MTLSQETLVPCAFGVDALVCCILLSLWLRHRDEKHALFWSIAEVSMAIATAVLIWGSPGVNQRAVIVIALAVSVGGFLVGTKAMIGVLKSSHIRPIALCLAIGAAATFSFWNSFSTWGPNVVAFAYGATFLGIGYLMIKKGENNRALGLIFMVRGAYNFANSLALIPELITGWIIFAFAVKGLSLVCLIQAIQNKIQNRYINAIDSLGNGFVVFDANGMIHSANERYVTLIGLSNGQKLAGTHLAASVTNVSLDMVSAYFARFAEAATYPYVETFQIRTSIGREVPVELRASPHKEGDKLFCMMLVMDITERIKREQESYRATHYDATTGLLNRHGLSKKLRECVTAAARSGVQCAVLLVGIDRFKRVNDSFGRAVGDQLLTQVSLRLQDCFEGNQLIGRVGADEFIVVIPELPHASECSEAAAYGEKIFHALNQRFSLSAQVITVSASIGVACSPKDGIDSETLLRNADIAMHCAKRESRGYLRFFSADMNSRSREMLIIDDALRTALAQDELYLLYQPIVGVKNGRMEKVEALLRWQSATLGTVGPDRFVPVAEESDLIIDLGAWVLNEACRQLGEWRSLLPDLIVTVNVSGRQLLDPSFVRTVQHALSNNNLEPGQLELELTERVLIRDVEHVEKVLAQLRGFGVQVSLDDFGTGYSSLSYITKFYINTLKIDRSFVIGMVDSERNRALVSTIIAMGRTLGMKLVAEGVESVAQAKLLADLGCHYLQGYLISRPVSSADLVNMTIDSEYIATVDSHKLVD